MPEVDLSQGTVGYQEHGTGTAVVLLHGVLVNGRVWERLAASLPGDVRVVVPDLPLGAHRKAMRPGADLSPLGLATMIAELLETLALDDATIVANDTGGALAQLLAAHHPERVGRLVLTNCDSFENFPPKTLRPVIKGLANVPGAVATLEVLGRLQPVRRASMDIARLAVDPIPDELVRSWVAPLRDKEVRRDLVTFLRGISPKYTLEAAERLKTFQRPVLLAWGTEDRYFPVQDGERLARTLPNARLERIEHARLLVQLDAPERLAELITAFIAAPGTGAT